MSDTHNGAGQPARPPTPGEFVAAGVVVRAQGIRGEVKIRLLCSGIDFLARCIEGGRMLIAPSAAPGPEGAKATAPLSLEIIRPQGDDFAIVRIGGVDTRNAAEALRGSVIGLVREDLPALEDESVYRFELEGLEVFDAAGALLGTVDRIEETPAHDQLVVRPADPNLKPFMAPLVDAFVRKIDLDAKRIVVELPKGLIESQQ